jgi:hypothetical protein
MKPSTCFRSDVVSTSPRNVRPTRYSDKVVLESTFAGESVARRDNLGIGAASVAGGCLCLIPGSPRANSEPRHPSVLEEQRDLFKGFGRTRRLSGHVRDEAAGSRDDIERARKVTVKVTAPAKSPMSSPSEAHFEIRIGEATTGFEPVIAVLQTAALPLGYVAWGSLRILTGWGGFVA